MENETVNFDELPHEDDWADATTRETEPNEEGLRYLAELEQRLLALAETPEVQDFINRNKEGEN